MGRNYALHRGCGWVLIVAGIMAMLFAIFLAVALWQSDEEAGVKNDADWEAYNARVEQLDTISDAAVRDSLIAEIPTPVIRQGGFATIFGLLMGLAIIVAAAFPLAIGCVLLVRYSKRREKEKELNI